MPPTSPALMPIRRACARCHARKLACSGRANQEQKCARCLKANATCVFATSVRGMRPASIAAAGLRTASEMDVDVDVDADSSNTSNRRARKKVSKDMVDQQSPATTMVLPPTTRTTTSPLMTPAPNDLQSPIDLGTSDDHINVVETLTKLNLNLLRHAATIPIHTDALLPSAFRSQDEFHLDQTFHLTAVMLDVTRTVHLPSTLYLAAADADAVTIDTASVFLILSCWHRFADIYESLFIHIRRCAEESILPAAASGGSVISLPAVRIGTYTASPTTSILLQIVAVLRHATQLAQAMSALATKLEADFYVRQTLFITPRCGGTNETTCKDIQSRALGFHDQVKSIKDMLMHVGLF